MILIIIGIILFFIIIWIWFRIKAMCPIITPENLKIQMTKDALRLIDVRHDHEFYGPLGHLPSAELKPLNEIAAWGDTIKNESLPIVLICHVGNRSRTAGLILAFKGIRTFNLQGGMIAWHKHGYPVTNKEDW